MPWGRLDDKFHRNPKVRALRRMKGGTEALGVWVLWWSWCLDDATLTGFVPEVELPRSDEKAANLLVQVGLWDRVEGGYVFHDFNEYNPTTEQIERKRAMDRERVAAKRAASRTNVARDIASDTEATRGATARESLPRASQPNPTQPNPSAYARDATPEPPAAWVLIAEHHAQRSGLLAASSADSRAAREIASVLGERWAEAYERWESDPWVREKRPPLRHLADHAAKYALPPEPAAQPTDRYAGWTTFGADDDGAVEATT